MAAGVGKTVAMLREGKRLQDDGVDVACGVVETHGRSETIAELGAEVVRLEGDDVAAALARFARERRITHAVFGRTRRPAWHERLRGSVLDRFMRLAPHVDVLVVGTESDDEAT